MGKEKKKTAVKNVLIKQVIVAMLLSFVTYSAVSKSPSYTWIFGLLESNMEIAKKHADLTFNERMGVKHQFKFQFCDYINKNTPEDAIILMPAAKVIREVPEMNTKGMSVQSLSNSRFASYFIYPRKFVYADKLEESPYKDKITHVAIVNFKGYEYLNYKVAKKSKFQVLPLKK